MLRSAPVGEMQFRVLGSLEVVTDGRSLALGGPKQRALLGVLLVNANRVTPTERLIDALWGERAPPGAAHTLQVYVSQLRKALRMPGSPPPETVLVTQGRGYVLRVEPDAVDLHRFERLVSEGRLALAAGEPERAAALLREALDLWRGPPLADLSYEAFAQPEIARIEDLRLSAVEDRIDADLALGRHAELVGELQGLVAEHPLRERLRADLMLALYRSGRQAEALQIARDTRKLLADELGIDPSPELQRLERAILEQDPELDLAPRHVGYARPAPRRRRILAATLLVIAALAVSAVVVVIVRISGSSPSVSSLDANSVGRIDPSSGSLVAGIHTAGKAPTAMAWLDGSLWVANTESRTVTRIDSATEQVEQTVPTEGTPTALAAGQGALWVLNGLHGNVQAIEPRTNEVVTTIEVPAGSGGIAFGAGAVWVTDTLGAGVTRIDPRTSLIVDTITLGERDASPKAIAAGGDALWVGDEFDALLWRIDASAGRVVGSPGLLGVPTAIAVGGGSVWVASRAGDLVTRIDPDSGLPSTIEVGDGPAGIAVGFGSVWVANGGEGTVSRIDISTGGVAETIDLGAAPEGVAVGSDDVWVSVPG